MLPKHNSTSALLITYFRWYDILHHVHEINKWECAVETIKPKAEALYCSSNS